MESTSAGPGALLLSLALAAGAVAFGALILRALLAGFKAIISNFKSNTD